MTDPYIDAQKRLDRGESVCVIDTSFRPCGELPSVFELRDKLRLFDEIKRLQSMVDLLVAERCHERRR